MKSYQFTIILFTALIVLACSNGRIKEDFHPSLDLVKESFDFKIGFNPDKSILYDGHLVLTGKLKVTLPFIMLNT